MKQKCSICKIIKNEDEFYSNSSRPRGITTRCKECYKIYAKTRKSMKPYWEKYNKVNFKKKRARNKLQYAIKIGKMFRKLCNICGNTETEAHHFDYDKPFEVIWFCRKHHMMFHRKIINIAL